jgi:hypothetical protein
MVAKGLPIPPIASTAVAAVDAVLRQLGMTPVIRNHPQFLHKDPGI